jgi:hypothetical protein
LRLFVFLCAATAFALPVATWGQTPQNDDDAFGPDAGDWEFQLSASGANDNDFDVGAFTLTGGLGYYLTEGFEPGIRHSMSFFDSDDTDSTFAATTSGFIDYNIDLDRFRPFFGVSLGGRYGDNTDEAFALAPEAGIKWYALEKTFLIGQMGYEFLFESADQADEAADDGNWVYTLGIGFNF